MKKILFIFILTIFIFISFGCETNNREIDDKLEYNPIESIFVGEKINLNILSNSSVKVETSTPSILKIDGLSVTGLSNGIGRITISNQSKSIEAEIEVIKMYISSYLKDISLYESETLDLSNVLSSNIKPIQYEIKDENILKIENDIIIPLSIGKTTINAFVEERNIKEQLTIQVEIKADIVYEISSTSFDGDIYVGDVKKVNMISNMENDEFSYSSSKPEILSFTSDGYFEAFSEGTTSIKITSTKTNAEFEKIVTVKYNYPVDNTTQDAVYLGIYNYGTVTNKDMANFKYRFFINGTTNSYLMTKVGDYQLQNQLEEGKIYNLVINNGTITNLLKLDDLVPFSTPKQNILVEGIIEDITKYDVTINGITYQFLASTKQYAITKTAGTAKVTTASIVKGNNVILTLSENGYCQNLYKEKAIKEYALPIEGVAGVRTLTNFFKIALSAVGHALYVYGGAWDFQDVGSSNQARTIGVADSWIEFFYEQDSNYSYKNTSNHAQTYYPFGAFNEYYYAGVDCSGFVGWVMYNLLNTENGKDGYVMGSTKMAKNFAEKGLGTYTREYSTPTSADSDFKVGDIISTDGHVWICLGVCNDGSIVIIHSTPSESKTGSSGGGAQLGAIGNSTNCDAYKLADKYNKQYYQDWSERYSTSLKSYSTYLSRNNSNTGKFSWYLNQNGVTDPDSLSSKLPDQILKILFNENE